MFNRKVVHEALKHTLSSESSPEWISDKPAASQDRLISLLLHDIFGGEILKTRRRKGWHFYNRIDGERIDFTRSRMGKCPEDSRLEDIPTSPGETCNYIEPVDYSTFFMRFVRAFEEAVGLNKNIPDFAA